jgi:hypothetical protein
MRRLLTALIAVLLLGTLGGCATRWVVDSEVRSFSNLPAGAIPAAGTVYRFERLPSQQGDGDAARSAEALEAFAMPALERAGLKRDDAAARFSVQIGARVTRTVSPLDDPWFYGGGPWGWGPGFGPYYGGWGRRGWGGPGWFGPGFAPAASPWYVREVSVVLRDLSNQRVVYETHARHDGPYAGDAAVLPVMFQAALQGFPVPPQGVRRVDIEIPTARAAR